MIKPINQLFIDPFFCVSIYFPFPGFDPFQINSKCLRHLLHNSSVGLALPLSIKLISCLVYPISEPNLSMLSPFFFPYLLDPISYVLFIHRMYFSHFTLSCKQPLFIYRKNKAYTFSSFLRNITPICLDKRNQPRSLVNTKCKLGLRQTNMLSYLFHSVIY